MRQPRLARRLYQRGIQRVLYHEPTHARAHFLLASALQEQGQLKKAIRHFQAAVYFEPRMYQAHFALGKIFETHYQPPGILKHFKAYLKWCPVPDSEAWISLGSLMKHLKQHGQAVTFFLKALEVNPLNSGLYLTLAESLQALGQLDVALDCCMGMARLFPEREGLMSMYMGYILEKNGEYELALRCYDEAVAKTPGYLPWHMKRDFSLPFIAEDKETLTEIYQRFLAVLGGALKSLNPYPPEYPPSMNTLSLNMLQNSLTYTCYHHTPPYLLRSQFGKLASLMAPYLENAPPPGEPYRSEAEKPYHIGVIFKPENINMCFAFNGDGLERLDPSRFQVTVYGQSGQIASLFDSGQNQFFTGSHIRWKILPTQLNQAYQVLQQERLDVLFFTEPYWDPYQYNLALLKPVARQITSWMNPGTTGLTQIDYFISSDLLESPGAEAHYSERLVRFSSLPTYLKDFEFTPTLTRADFGLEDHWHLYASPQNLLKFHPDFDTLIEGILEKDPLGHMVLLASDKQQRLCQKLIARFEKRFPHLMPRILFLPQLTNAQFLNLLNLADIILDPLYYGGGTTSYQALGLGKIILTCPSPFMVGKITAAMYAQMGITGLAFESLGALVEKALILGSDADLRAELEAEISSKKHHLFEDEKVVHELEQFLEALCAS